MDNVGFIGLGRMGRPMASNLCRKGFRLTVFDINRDAVAELELLQARGASSVAEVAQSSGVVVTMLPNASVVDHVVSASDGILANAAPGYEHHRSGNDDASGVGRGREGRAVRRCAGRAAGEPCGQR